MSEILTSEKVLVSAAEDLVVWYLGTHTIKLYYHTAFEIVGKGRIAAKLAMRHEGLQIPDWRDLSGELSDRAPSIVPLHPHYRRTGRQSNVKHWEIAWEGALVVFTFDELVAKMHYTDTLQVIQYIRNSAKAAKNWSGDRHKGLHMTAYLNDAEENYKYGYAV